MDDTLCLVGNLLRGEKIGWEYQNQQPIFHMWLLICYINYSVPLQCRAKDKANFVLFWCGQLKVLPMIYCRQNTLRFRVISRKVWQLWLLLKTNIICNYCCCYRWLCSLSAAVFVRLRVTFPESVVLPALNEMVKPTNNTTLELWQWPISIITLLNAKFRLHN